MLKYAMPPMGAEEKVLFTQRAYFPFRGTALSAYGALIVLTDARLLFVPPRILGIPGFGESVVRQRSVVLRDITRVEPVGESAMEVHTRFGNRVSVRIPSPTGPGFIWSAHRFGPYRDETVRRIRAACAQFGAW